MSVLQKFSGCFDDSVNIGYVSYCKKKCEFFTVNADETKKVTDGSSSNVKKI